MEKQALISLFKTELATLEATLEQFSTENPSAEATLALRYANLANMWTGRILFERNNQQIVYKDSFNPKSKNLEERIGDGYDQLLWDQGAFNDEVEKTKFLRSVIQTLVQRFQTVRKIEAEFVTSPTEQIAWDTVYVNLENSKMILGMSLNRIRKGARA